MYASDLCSSLRGPPAPHHLSPGSPPLAPGALPAQEEAEGVAGEEGHSPRLSAASQACEHNNGMTVRELLYKLFYIFSLIIQDF